ncbi:hypothetical protein EWM64_g3051 [Hericium alpestre]|uniref:Mediator of RNA polymerase II transcription subunit 9 n=1 Tax=Hericium alpestre TaxID=135208 RepID=A0A4Z0A3E4_9AGAM|nr:hypothetical protein EWM64_g3051 [Hericium alpestre]
MDSEQPLQSSAFESLLPKLLTILELTQTTEGTVSTPQSKQELLQATNEFKESLIRAKELANALSGGELVIAEQDEIIAMLERLKEKKGEQLASFSKQELSTTPASQSFKMEIDSTASTPA